MPVLILAIVRTKPQHFTWRLAWVGFLIFDLAILSVLHVDVFATLPLGLLNWYFPIALGIPVVLLAIAFIRDLTRRELDWWTVLTCLPIISIWLISVVMQAV
ncbi:hypothetical protein RISK_002812 [Rhodopirellula islandica]|uniref:Transmembrane protein n=1 Tax=Rhodopirellula islandica TaxID=595434 RepID=A0A0J1BEU7_RHOIS|nr:hypothetical protein [Rhodopirellula islandica]KLU05050.1 hypothetical protein RISK_002812 [Rhodopirellula islandica]